MVNVKKIKLCSYNFVILLTLSLIYSCSPNAYKKIDSKAYLFPINDSIVSVALIDNFISPFRTHITNDLDSILAFNEVTQDKSKGKWESNIGNLLAKVTLDLSNPIFQKKENKTIDFCLLNHGGIRSIIPAGNVTTRNAFEVMPFENSVIIVGITGKEVMNLAKYVLDEKKPHPLSGITIYTNSDYTEVKRILINNNTVVDDQIYYVATSDYLSNGGDNMIFLKESTIKFDLNYKLRNLLIDYFKSIDTIPNILTQHIITE